MSYSRTSSPNASINTRVSRFREDGHENHREDQSRVPFIQANVVETNMHPYPSTEQILLKSMPYQQPSHHHTTSTANSDSERLLPSSQPHVGKSFKPRAAPQFRNSRGFYVARLVLRGLVVVLSLAIVGVLGDAIRGYDRTKDVEENFTEGSGRYKVWPGNLKVWPSLWLVGTAVIAAGLGGVLLLASFNAKVRHMTKTGNITTMVVSSICLALWIAVAAYYASWDTKETNWDLMSWACTHNKSGYHYTTINFGQTCGKMRFAIFAAAALAALELINLIIFVVWVVRQRRKGGSAKRAVEVGA